MVDDKQDILEGNTRGVTGQTYGPQSVADQMLKFVRDNKNKPFFLYYPTVIPHLALQAPEKEIAAYRGKWPETPYTGRSYQPHPTPKSCYAAMITFMDRQIGRLLTLLEETGLAENTVIFFTSDNGVTHLKAQVDYEFFKSAEPFRGLKGSVYEGGIRVPLVVRWPGKVKPGTTSDYIGAFYDVMPTLAEIAGVEAPSGIDGISFVPTLTGHADKQKQHEFLVWEFHGYGGQQAVRMGDWKAVRTGCFKNPEGAVELYNLAKDIGESKNVAAEHPDRVKEMAGIMAREHAPSEHWDFRKRSRRKK